MTFRLLWTLVTQNFKTQRHIIIPFILVISTLFGIEFILLSLNMNASIHKHSDVIPVFISIGNFLCVYLDSFLFFMLIVLLCDVVKRAGHEYDFGYGKSILG